MFAKPSLTIKRRLKATPEKVYRAWTEPAQIARWWGPGPCEVLKAEADTRVGGRFRVIFRTGDGEEHNVGGEYSDVVPNERLSFSWSWISMPERVSQVTVSLRPDGEGTMLTLHHEQLFNQASRDGHNRGWTESLDKLEQLFT